ncbi:MAG: LysE family translocator [Saprospiraceae bacterium]|nr:LysE family translocator [Saprospiraceae bacterium]
MLPFQELLLFIFSAFTLAISPGPNMLYLISRTISQGKRAGFISLLGVICGFLMHIALVSFGLTALLLAVPMAFVVLRWTGVFYLLYLAWQALKPSAKSLFETTHLPEDSDGKLFTIGFLTNALNPKMAVFYLSLFPQFIHQEYGSPLVQSLQLGFTQIIVSASVNCMVIATAGLAATFFREKPQFVRVQKWFMGGVLTALAVRMALTERK